MRFLSKAIQKLRDRSPSQSRESKYLRFRHQSTIPISQFAAGWHSPLSASTHTPIATKWLRSLCGTAREDAEPSCRVYRDYLMACRHSLFTDFGLRARIDFSIAWYHHFSHDLGGFSAIIMSWVARRLPTPRSHRHSRIARRNKSNETQDVSNWLADEDGPPEVQSDGVLIGIDPQWYLGRLAASFRKRSERKA